MDTHKYDDGEDMNFVIKTLGNYRMIILPSVILFLLIMGIIFLKKIVCRRRKNREIEQAAADKIRDENLNNVILNNCAKDSNLKEIYKPYDVDYSNPNDEHGKDSTKYEKKADNHIMVQLIEKTELSTRKFMMNPIKKICIGSSLQDNDITVMAEGISPHQCEIFSGRNNVYIKNLSSENRTIIKRKKERAIVDERGVRLLSNDVVILGCVSYEITIINERI